jgi:hypothetical protein
MARGSGERDIQQLEASMKSLMAIAALALVASPVMAQVKPCEELKSEIDAKIRNNGVTVFTLTIVDKDAPEDGKVVGTCDGSTKKIVYKRGASAPAETTTEATTKQ